MCNSLRPENQQVLLKNIARLIKTIHNDLRQKIKVVRHICYVKLERKSQGETLSWEIKTSKSAHAYWRILKYMCMSKMGYTLRKYLETS